MHPRRADRTQAFILVGPTASGKTTLAHLVARLGKLDILSADALLVYQGMDIGTAKPTVEERAGIRYGGIDLTPPTHPFSVGAYLDHARHYLAERKKDRPLIVVGGTGLYVKALLRGLDDMPETPPALRAEIESLYEGEGLAGLQAACQAADPDAFDAIKDKRNPRRLMRTLELARLGYVPENRWEKAVTGVAIGLSRPRDELNNRIERRVELMYSTGLLDEVRALRKQYLDWSATARAAIGYREANAVLDGEMSVQGAKDQTIRRTRQLARRQMTWFKHQIAVEWLPHDGLEESEAAEELLNRWRTHGPCELTL